MTHIWQQIAQWCGAPTLPWMQADNAEEEGGSTAAERSAGTGCFLQAVGKITSALSLILFIYLIVLVYSVNVVM